MRSYQFPRTGNEEDAQVASEWRSDFDLPAVRISDRGLRSSLPLIGKKPEPSLYDWMIAEGGRRGPHP